jgi:hypothetical protein
MSVSPPLNGPGRDGASEHRGPNAGYALSPPRAQSSRRDYGPHLPSPLGLSNYDAFDVESTNAKNGTVVDLYSGLDDEDDDDRYSYLWDEEDDERNDSPFSPSVFTNDSHTTATTRTSQILKTPPQQAYDDFDITGALLGDLDEIDTSANSTWPRPFLGAANEASMQSTSTKPTVSKLSIGGVSPNFRAFDAGPLAVQYPGAPVPFEEPKPVVTVPVVTPKLAPASMSPNLRPFDTGQ